MKDEKERIGILETRFENQKEADERHDKALTKLFSKSDGAFDRIEEAKELNVELKINFNNLIEKVREEIQAGEAKFKHNKDALSDFQIEVKKEFKKWNANGEKKQKKIWDNLKWVLATGIAIFALLH